MHIRFSSCRGLPVVEEEMHHAIAHIDSILINPDTGNVEGFFVAQGGFFHVQQLFLSTLDVLSIGMRVTVRSANVIVPLEEHIRLAALWKDARPLLGQEIRTEHRTSLGTCSDVQFDTRTFQVEWLFPHRLFGFGRPIPITAVIEVLPDAIIVRDLVSTLEEKNQTDGTLLPQIPDAA